MGIFISYETESDNLYLELNDPSIINCKEIIQKMIIWFFFLLCALVQTDHIQLIKENLPIQDPIFMLNYYSLDQMLTASIADFQNQTNSSISLTFQTFNNNSISSLSEPPQNIKSFKLAPDNNNNSKIAFLFQTQIVLYDYTFMNKNTIRSNDSTYEYLNIQFGENNQILYYCIYNFDGNETYLLVKHDLGLNEVILELQLPACPFYMEYGETGLKIAYQWISNITQNQIIQILALDENLDIVFEGEIQAAYQQSTKEVEFNDSFVEIEDNTKFFIDDNLAYSVISRQKSIEIWNLTNLQKIDEMSFASPVQSLIACENSFFVVIQSHSVYTVGAVNQNLENQTYQNQTLENQTDLINNTQAIIDSANATNQTLNQTIVFYSKIIQLDIINAIKLNDHKYTFYPYNTLFCADNKTKIFPIFSNRLYDVEVIHKNVTSSASSNQPQQQQSIIIPETPPTVQPNKTNLQIAIEEAIEILQNPETQQSLSVISSSIPIISSSVGQTVLKFINFNVDMFCLYSLHPTNYTQFINVFAKEMDIMAELRMKPEFLETIDLSRKISFEERDNYYKKALLSSFSKKPMYFLQSVKNFYTMGLLTNISVFVVMFFIRLLFSLVKNINKLCNAIYETLLFYTHWWMLFISICQTNLSILVFHSFLQISHSFSFDCVDKLNLIASITVLLILILFVLTFYPLLYDKTQESQMQRICDIAKYRLNGFFLMSIVKNANNLTRSAIHAVFLFSDEGVLIGLTACGILLIVYCVIVRKIFRSSYFWLLGLTLILSVMAFDLALLLSTLIDEDDFEGPVFILALLIIGVSFIQNISIIIIDIFDIFRKWCISNNKISDLPQTTMIKEISLQANRRSRKNIFKETDQQIIKQNLRKKSMKRSQNFDGLQVIYLKKAKIAKNCENSPSKLLDDPVGQDSDVQEIKVSGRVRQFPGARPLIINFKEMRLPRIEQEDAQSYEELRFADRKSQVQRMHSN